MATVKKRILSGSIDGLGIVVAATATLGTEIHEAVAGTTPGTYDEVWLWAMNNDDADAVLTIEFGDDAAGQNIVVTIPFQSGLIPVIPGFPLQNGAAITAFADSGSVITLHGFVNTITD
jgi:hypothetical protein